MSTIATTSTAIVADAALLKPAAAPLAALILACADPPDLAFEPVSAEVQFLLRQSLLVWFTFGVDGVVVVDDVLVVVTVVVDSVAVGVVVVVVVVVGVAVVVVVRVAVVVVTVVNVVVAVAVDVVYKQVYVLGWQTRPSLASHRSARGSHWS